MTAGNWPRDYGNWPYLEWYSEANGRVVLEPGRDCVRVIGTPLPGVADRADFAYGAGPESGGLYGGACGYVVREKLIR